jgi:hypothetical protein
MANGPSKKRKKATPARRVVGPSTTRRKKASKALNEERLNEYIRLYEENLPTNTRRRTKANEVHPRGVPLENLIEYTDKHKNIRYRSVDKSIDISNSDYLQLLANPNAVTRFTPIHEMQLGRKRIVAYRDMETGQQVTPYFMSKYFRPYFSSGDDGERARAYEASVQQGKLDRRARHYNLIDSFAIRNPQFREQWPKNWRSKIAKDPTFNRLVDELETWHYKMFGITEDNIIIYDEEYNIPINLETYEEQKEWLISKLGEDKDYQQVLVELGRRLPSEERPVGSYGPGYIKSEVIPFYENYFGGEDIGDTNALLH